MSEQLEQSSLELNLEIKQYQNIAQDFLRSHGYGSRDVSRQLKTYKPMESCVALYAYIFLVK